jgi:hypothetical protein
MLAPLSTGKVDFRIDDRMSTLAALQLWFILKEFQGMTTLRTRHFKDVIGLPISLVLSRASNHVSALQCAQSATGTNSPVADYD